MALPNSGAVSSLAEDPPTLGVTFDLDHVLVLAWEEPREQALGSAHVQYANNNLQCFTFLMQFYLLAPCMTQSSHWL